MSGRAVAALVALVLVPLIGAAAAQPAALPPVAAPAASDPTSGPARATMIMVHGGGWAGHSAAGQQILMKIPGEFLLARRWRIVSVDYNEGAAGLQDVLDAVAAEVARRTSDGPLCLYGESSGAHLALVAASRLRAFVDCVIGVGTPIDLVGYGTHNGSNDQVRLLADRIHVFFGTTPEALAAWDPLSLASAIDADVLLLREADDYLIAATDIARFQAAHVATRTVELQSGDPANAADAYLHGTVSAGGRKQYAAEVAGFVDRAIAVAGEARQAARAEAASGAGVPESFNTPATLVHSIVLSAAHARALAGSIVAGGA